ncbi:hypothetical protein [Halorussus salinus]|uniref:hypothetical protein n=1 Tax=Halorussus salinus TaxID=1364935 RepID=UPI001092A450|nr:hypothetical protein [Halorussus salinus]
MARDVTARDSTTETALLDRRSARWHAGPTATVTERGTAVPSGPTSAGATLPAGTTPSTGGLPFSTPGASGPEVQDGS